MTPAKRARLLTLLVAAVLAFASAAIPSASAAPDPAPVQHSITYDGYSFMIDGKRTYLWSGEFHYYRLPNVDLWRDVLQKMKAAGFNATSLYFDWGYHSPRPGVYDFTGVRDVDKLLDIAAEVGIYVIARPGPYINAEIDGGGFPGWLDTKPGNVRSTDPAFLKYSDEWQAQIDRILARHQLVDGRGTVVAYQVENEFYDGSAAGRAHMKHLEDKARADGIKVPLTGNHQGTFNTGDAALDVDGVDHYPQGFDCSNPQHWWPVPDIASEHPAGKPLYTAEFQGGAFDPWGGPGYAKCAQLINDQFANVFYKNNIAAGATAQSFYMTYGGTSWGWSAIPQNYTSYDYGAALTEARQLDAKYYEDKLIGYFTQSVAPLTKTDGFASASPTDPAVTDTARINPDTRTQFHTLRHTDSTSTTTNTTSVALDLAAHSGYTYDDRDAAIAYTGTWSHVGAEQNYTGGDYQHTESFSQTAGDSVSIPFTGTGIRWVTSKDPSHGIADVYLDGAKVSSVDLYAPAKVNQIIGYEARGLAAGAHTLKIVVTGQKNASAFSPFVVVDAIDVLSGSSSDYYPVVPQQPGTGITLNGRESKILVAGYDLGQTRLQYSTSEIMTSATIGGRDIAVLYGDPGQPGETVLRFAKQPQVQVLDGAATSTWDSARGDLRLNYTHQGLTRVLVSAPGARPLLLLLAGKDTAKTFWRQDTANGPVLVRGTHVVRTAAGGDRLELTGDTGSDGAVEVFSNAREFSWNGCPVEVKRTSSGSLAGALPTAKPVKLPDLTGWRQQQEAPEAQPGFDDSSWPVATKTSSNSKTTPGSLPVLFADDYGFHAGNTWYRGHFTSSGKETGIGLTNQSGGSAGDTSVWLNGTFIGSARGDGRHDFTFPPGSLKSGDNVLSVLTVDMGHEETGPNDNNNRSARGLVGARIDGALTSVTWRLQGTRGGENGLDPVRGPLNTGGLYGERAGWSLPGFPDRGWKPVTLPASGAAPGVTWYRTTSKLDLPDGQDTSLGIEFTDNPQRHYRALLFVNGWQVGQYLNDTGPQHSFPVPDGVLNPHGTNTIAIAVWNTDATTGGLGQVKLVDYGSYASPLTVHQNSSPGYDSRRYAIPATAVRASLSAPDTVTDGQQFTVSATVTASSTVTNLTPSLSIPDGWTAGAPTPASVPRLDAGKSATFTWPVTVGKAAKVNILTANIGYRQDGRTLSTGDTRVAGTVPPKPPAGTDEVSSLEFLSATNGWGPVERDTSNGEDQAGDGHPISLRGKVYQHGLGVHADGDVEVYLGGGCDRYTATVGVDDETHGGGSVAFQVLVDGKSVVTTPVLTGTAAPVSVDVPVTGGQVLDLVVNDGGDGNGLDHADWADAVLSCH